MCLMCWSYICIYLYICVRVRVRVCVCVCEVCMALIILLFLLFYIENSSKRLFLVEIVFLLLREGLISLEGETKQNINPPVVTSRSCTVNSFTCCQSTSPLFYSNHLFTSKYYEKITYSINEGKKFNLLAGKWCGGGRGEGHSWVRLFQWVYFCGT